MLLIGEMLMFFTIIAKTSNNSYRILTPIYNSTKVLHIRSVDPYSVEIHLLQTRSYAETQA